jgi:hypothetical protein
MKKLLLVLLLVSPIAKAQTTNPAPHCSHDYDGGSTPQTHYISKVQIGNFVNLSGTVQQPFPHYIYYNNLPVTVAQNVVYNITLTLDTFGISRTVFVFVDWSKDGMFSAMDMIFNDVASGSDSIMSGMFTVPGTSLPGITRVRIILAEDTTGGYINAACANNIDWGETEDYDFNVVPFITEVELLQNVNSFSMHPNPSKDHITVQSQNKNIQFVSIYNISGQQVFQNEFNSVENAELNLEELRSGIYTVSVQSTDGNVNRKLFVKE